MIETLDAVVEADASEKAAPIDVHLVDRLLFSGSMNELSTAVIDVIHQTIAAKQPVYQPDTVTAIAESIVAAGGEENVVGHINRVLTAFGALHDAVRQRLQDPQTEIEREIVANHAQEVAPWTEPFKRPPARFIVHKLFPDGHVPKAIQEQLAMLEQGAEAQQPAPFTGSPYRTLLEKRKPGEVLGEIKDLFVGLDELKTEAERLAFMQAFDNALAKKGATANGAEKVYGEAISGNDGLGKSRFAHKKAELLVALGLAGPRLVEFNERNAAAPTMNMPPQAMAALFAQADIINIEIPPSLNDGRPDAADFGKRLVAALQASFEGREEKPVVFLTGKAEVIDDVITHNPGLKPYIGSYYLVENFTLNELGKVLDRHLGHGPRLDGDAPGARFTLDEAARAEVLKAFDAGLKKLGKEFPNAVEPEQVAKNLRTALAERLFGPKATPGADYSMETLTTITLDDVKALNMNRIIAGPAVAKPARIGF